MLLNFCCMFYHVCKLRYLKVKYHELILYCWYILSCQFIRYILLKLMQINTIVWDVSVQLSDHSGGCRLWCCWAVLLYTERRFFYLVNPHRYKWVGQNITSNTIQQNHKLQPPVWTKTQHYNLYEGRIYCRTVVLDCLI